MEKDKYGAQIKITLRGNSDLFNEKTGMNAAEAQQ